MTKIKSAVKSASRRIDQKTARAVVLVPVAELVTVEHGQPVTTTERVAAAAGLKHASVIRLVRERLADLEELGKVRFQIRLNPQGSPVTCPTPTVRLSAAPFGCVKPASFSKAVPNDRP